MESAKEADDFMKFFCSSIIPSAMSNYRMFISDDNVDKDKIDHYVVMDEGLLIGVNPMKGFKEVEIHDVMLEVNSVYAAKISNRDAYHKKIVDSRKS